MAEIPDARKYEKTGRSYPTAPASSSYRREAAPSPRHDTDRSTQQPRETPNFVPWIVGGLIVFVLFILLIVR
jgi:hypothetical protein